MNYITMLKEREAATEQWESQFRSHLHSDKFKGTDNGERKDWIAVADVLRWLDTLNNVRGAIR